MTKPLLADKQLSVTQALPNGAATVNGASIDLQNGPRGDFLAHCQVELAAPALVVGDLANSSTMTYKLEDSADNSSFATVFDAVCVQTGAGGVGAAAETVNIRLPTTIRRYIRITATNSNSGDASDKSYTWRLLF